MTPEACSIDGCARRRAKRGWCGTHYERWRTHGDPLVTKLPRDNPSYLSIHKQVHRRRGKASEHVCQHCGGQAKQWAYDHLDPDERIGVMVVRGERFQLRYSVDHARYMPLCIPCHRKFDAVPRVA